MEPSQLHETGPACRYPCSHDGTELTTTPPPGTITFPLENRSRGTSINLVWGNKTAGEIIIKCDVIEMNNDHGSGFHPQETLPNHTGLQLYKDGLEHCNHRLTMPPPESRLPWTVTPHPPLNRQLCRSSHNRIPNCHCQHNPQQTL